MALDSMHSMHTTRSLAATVLRNVKLAWLLLATLPAQKATSARSTLSNSNFGLGRLKRVVFKLFVLKQKSGLENLPGGFRPGKFPDEAN